MGNYVQIIGSGDAFGTAGRANTCFYLNFPTLKGLIDCGASSITALKRCGLSTEDVDHIFISHLHGDHYGGLPFFILEAARIARRAKPLTVVAPPGAKEKVRELLNLLYPGADDALEVFPLVHVTYEGFQTFDREDYSFTSFPVKHSVATYPHGIRIRTSGIEVAYSGDTEWTNMLPILAEGTDLFICECNNYDIEAHGHLSFMTIKEYLPHFNTKKIVLTHLGQNAEQYKEKIDLPIAEEGMVIYL